VLVHILLRWDLTRAGHALSVPVKVLPGLEAPGERKAFDLGPAARLPGGGPAQVYHLRKPVLPQHFLDFLFRLVP